MDYRITDSLTDPIPFADELHSEKLLRLPDSQWCFRPFGTPLEIDPLPARKNGFVTFGSFNNLAKASDTLLKCWTRILIDSPDSHLRITRVRSPQRAAAIIALFARSGIAAERIECTAYRSTAQYGSQFAGVDIALDHFPYNGVTTTCESLHAGVPVVSMYGAHGVSRSGLSILTEHRPQRTDGRLARRLRESRSDLGRRFRTPRADSLEPSCPLSNRRCAMRSDSRPASRRSCALPGGKISARPSPMDADVNTRLIDPLL